MKRVVYLSLVSLVVAACQDVPTQAPGPAGAYPFSAHLAGERDPSNHDTYLANNAKNENFGTELTLNLVTSAKNRLLVEFADATVSDAKAFLDATGGTVLLTLTIAVNSGDWGPEGRTIDVHRMKQGWTGGGATWNCPDDTDLTNNQPDCTPWDVSKSGPNPWEATPTATATITTGESGDLHWDITDDIVAWSDASANFGWVIKRTNEEEEGGVSFHSFDHAEVGVVEPRLVGSVCPPGSSCGETLVDLNGQESNPLFTVEVTGSPIIAKLNVAAANVIVLGANGLPLPELDVPAELIFSLERIVDANDDDVKCLGLEDPSLEVGPCWEGKTTNPANGDEFEVRFVAPQLLAVCLPFEPIDDLTAVSDVVRLVRRKGFDPGNIVDHSPSEAPLEVLPLAAAEDGILDCEDVFVARFDSNPLMRFARNLWENIRERVSPRPLYAARTAMLRRANTRNNTSGLVGLSAFSYAKLQVPYRDGGYTYVTVGRKCDDCDLDRVPRKWSETSFDDALWNGGGGIGAGAAGIAPFGDQDKVLARFPSMTCKLDVETAAEITDWPQADPRFNPPARTELLLRKSFFVMDPTNEHEGPINLEVRLTGRNDFRAYLNGTEVTEFVREPMGVKLKKNKGWVLLPEDLDDPAEDCPAYDEVIFTIPESLVLLGTDNLLAIRARSRVDEPSFADVQVNVIEGN